MEERHMDVGIPGCLGHLHEVALDRARNQILDVVKLAPRGRTMPGWSHTAISFAVLLPGIVQYRFASSSCSPRELKDVKAYVTHILNTLGRTPESVLNAATPQSTLF
ncbi:hypothetical protein B0T25DRAFT_569584 [Lasiosphaeria hispida]|uniref:Uncharacterized protein n=1 Tax=Lasiosphaeria hispida TaxID=260671 RepID=A0AAJ0MBT3_9PEZI|nr:hypothetical protein B0T25DRAFT_569584 [Lasiosphaeria hispida]